MRANEPVVTRLSATIMTRSALALSVAVAACTGEGKATAPAAAKVAVAAPSAPAEAFAPFGYFVLVDGSIGIVDLFQFRMVDTFKIGHRGVHRIAVMPDNRTLYLANTDNLQLVKVTVSHDGKQRAIQELGPATVGLHAFMASPDGSKVVQTSRIELKDHLTYQLPDLPDDSIAILDTKSDKIVAQVKLQSPAGAEFSPDGKRLYVANVHHGSVSVVDMETYQEIKRITFDTGNGVVDNFLDDIDVSDDGKLVAVAGGMATKTVVLYDAATLDPLGTIALADIPHDVEFAPDGKALWVIDRDRLPQPADEAGNASISTDIHVYDTATRQETHLIVPPVTALRASLPTWAKDDVFVSTAVGGLLRLDRTTGALKGQIVVGGIGRPVICGGLAF